MRVDETRALMQECFSLSKQRYGEDFYSLDDEKQNEIVDEASRRILNG